MQWMIEGADRISGHERIITIEAETSSQAERIARSRGLLISNVRVQGELVAAEYLAAMVGETLDAPARAELSVGVATLTIDRPVPKSKPRTASHPRVSAITSENELPPQLRKARPLPSSRGFGGFFTTILQTRSRPREYPGLRISAYVLVGLSAFYGAIALAAGAGAVATVMGYALPGYSTTNLILAAASLGTFSVLLYGCACAFIAVRDVVKKKLKRRPTKVTAKPVHRTASAKVHGSPVIPVSESVLQ